MFIKVLLFSDYMNSYDIATDPKYMKALPVERQVQADNDPLELLSSNKRELLRSKIELIVAQLDERKTIHDDLLYGIQQDELRCSALIMQRDSVRDYDSARDIELKYSMKLSKERREETARMFRDTAMLKRDLVDALIAYKGARQNERFMRAVE